MQPETEIDVNFQFRWDRTVRNASRPKTGHLKPAFTFSGGEIIPQFREGSRIIMERRRVDGPVETWWDTNVYIVLSYNATRDEGPRMVLWNPETDQKTVTDPLTALTKGYQYFIAGNGPKGGLRAPRGRPKKS